VEGWQFSSADSEYFGQFQACPDAAKYPHAYRWYIHIAAIQGIRRLSIASPAAPAVKTAYVAESSSKKAEEKKAAADDDDDEMDVFGDDEEKQDEGKESRKDMLARLKKEAEERTAKKEAKQRTLVSIEIKPWGMEQDLMVLWKKITQTVVQDGLKWGEGCTLADVAFGIKKIQTTFTMGVNNSSDDVVDAIQAMEDEVQSVEVTSMNVL
jgi:elongation factor 1-beta